MDQPCPSQVFWDHFWVRLFLAGGAAPRFGSATANACPFLGFSAFSPWAFSSFLSYFFAFLPHVAGWDESKKMSKRRLYWKTIYYINLYMWDVFANKFTIGSLLSIYIHIYMRVLNIIFIKVSMWKSWVCMSCYKSWNTNKSCIIFMVDLSAVKGQSHIANLEIYI